MRVKFAIQLDLQYATRSFSSTISDSHDDECVLTEMLYDRMQVRCGYIRIDVSSEDYILTTFSLHETRVLSSQIMRTMDCALIPNITLSLSHSFWYCSLYQSQHSAFSMHDAIQDSWIPTGRRSRTLKIQMMTDDFQSQVRKNLIRTSCAISHRSSGLRLL